MSSDQAGTFQIGRAAYDFAWQEFTAIDDLTVDERRSGPNKLRRYIDLFVATGERDPIKIARSSLGLMRENEQIIRSMACVKGTSSTE